MASLNFHITKNDKETKARAGFIETAHGVIETPVFMPVGTRGVVKTLTPQHLLDIGAQIILGNAFHLMLRPGIEVIQKAGGLHRFMQWPRPILTDSGGYQIFSLSKLSKITDAGVYFKSPIDGSRHFFGPIESMEAQKCLGADIVMTLDHCPPFPCEDQLLEKALQRNLEWAKICRDYKLNTHQNLFCIIHGGMNSQLRCWSAKTLVDGNFDGYAIGGFFAGGLFKKMSRIVEEVIPILPEDKPRYLMGIGTPRDIIKAVMQGVDMFDCVLPTRNARHGTAFTWSGKVEVKAGRYAQDFSALDPNLDCYTSLFSRAYIRHLLNVHEVTGLTLVTLQNLAFYLDFMRQLRQAIQQDTLKQFYQRICEIYPS